MKALGHQVIAEFWGCNDNINSPEAIRKALEEAVKEAKVVLLDLRVHTFNPQGVTGVAVIAESHLTIHTWPEHRYAAVDIFTCGNDANPEAALEVFRKAFEPKRVEIIELKRGVHLE